MIYCLFHALIKITCYFYFKKIRLFNPDKFENKHPVIICANHGNSFMDAILIAINCKRKLHFLVRSDVFNTPFKRWFFGQLNMMPIYRIRDGREALKNNDAVFLKCQEILSNNGAIVIFPEGNCVIEKRLRAFKTGFVHLAFNADLPNLRVQAITLNYSKPDEFYTEASLTFAEPILVNDIKVLANKNEFEFNKLLMKSTYDLLRKNMVYIEKIEDDFFYEAVLEMKRNDDLLLEESFLNKQIATIAELENLRISDMQVFEEIRQKVLLYFNYLKTEEVKDAAVAKNSLSKFKAGLTFPFYILGYILNAIPSHFLENTINTKIKERQFKSSVRMVLSLAMYPLYIFTISFFLNYGFHNYLFSVAIIAGLFGLYYINFSEFNLFRQQNNPKIKKEKIEELKRLRGEITKYINL
ncbi:1-acyl-sn-glycerol-3-phosphate acyltransferase [Pedobacter alpinus]|uniref:1-acyl-sn-glycerol-3-phosphate acyltransferase n=1 Tax=Pedobacter alpinus TaxID=1590643 RepID=A0ABW5TW60_9SPHI